MAWLGAIALIGLIVCGIDALHNLVRTRKERSLAPGEVLAPSWWTPRRVAFAAAGVVSAIVLVIAVLSLVLGTSTRTTKLVVAPTTTTTTTTPLPGSTTTTAALGPARAPQLVRVDVLNGSGVARAATTKATALTAAGYRIASTGNATLQMGTVVECRAGFEADAIALARVVGPGTLVQGFPNVDPSGSAKADCVVVLGQ